VSSEAYFTFPISVEQLASLINAEVVGNGQLILTGFGELKSDLEHSLCFSTHNSIDVSKHPIKRAIIVKKSILFEHDQPITLLKVEDPYRAFARLTRLHNLVQNELTNIHSTVILNRDVSLGKCISIGAYSIIGYSSRIGDQVVIGAQVSIGENVHIGNRTLIYDGVKILANTAIGSDCILYPNTVIGTDGFGHIPTTNGYEKIIHQGRVIIGDRVEVGSNCTIDKGVIGDTVIEDGVKLDNLIHVAHGVHIEKDVVIAAQTGISGSASIGARSMIGGQTGIVGHIRIAEDSKIQGKSGVAGDIREKNKKWYGYPAMEYWDYLRSYALFKILPEIVSRITALERKSKKDP
jgi:UDP-3-O-[3-hydroxymyristoyl] glucosamine N-acyltransferase